MMTEVIFKKGKKLSFGFPNHLAKTKTRQIDKLYLKESLAKYL